jgi:hypothetical protein
MPAAVVKLRRPKAKAPKTTWREGALTIFVRDRHYHVRGTIRHAGLKRRVRESLKIPFSRENLDKAKAAAAACEEKIRSELGGGVSPLSAAEVGLSFISRPIDKPLGATDVAAVKELIRHFRTRILREIPPSEFISFVKTRQEGNKSATSERFLNTVHAYLTEAIATGQYDKMPEFKRDRAARNPIRRARREVANVRPYLVSLLLEASHITIASQLCVEAATGARVSSILFGCALDDLTMAPNQMRITFHDTKNGLDVPAALPEEVRPLLEDYQAWRALQVRAGHVSASGKAPLFLTPLGRPYKPNPNFTGTRNKTAFNGSKRRAIALLKVRAAETIAACEAAGDRAGAKRARQIAADDERILRAITQHWMRHKLATELGRVDLRAAMKQGGWLDLRSVQGYLIEDAEFQRAAVENRVLFDTNLTREEPSDDAK